MLDKLIKDNKGIFNRATRLFLLKLFALIVIWECSYHFILKPIRIPDKYLTDLITATVTKGINVINKPMPPATWKYQGNTKTMAHIFQGNKKVFSIDDECNGLDLIVIYLGLILLLPYPIKRKIIFSIAGVIGIILVNILRCISLYWIWGYDKGLFELNHKYLFTLIMYLLIFCGWMLFTKTNNKNEEVG